MQTAFSYYSVSSDVCFPLPPLLKVLFIKVCSFLSALYINLSNWPLPTQQYTFFWPKKKQSNISFSFCLCIKVTVASPPQLPATRSAGQP